jgi:hypothetical protein
MGTWWWCKRRLVPCRLVKLFVVYQLAGVRRETSVSAPVFVEEASEENGLLTHYKTHPEGSAALIDRFLFQIPEALFLSSIPRQGNQFRSPEGVSVESRWSLGGVPKESRRSLGGVSVESRRSLGGVSVESRWSLGGETFGHQKLDLRFLNSVFVSHALISCLIEA